VKRLFLVLAVAGWLWLPARAAGVGDAAPAVNLPSLGGGQVQLHALLPNGPVLLWFTAVTSDDMAQAAALHQLASQHGAQLVIVPVVGADQVRAQQIAGQVPGAIVLLDLDGRVVLSYAGEYIVGVCPNPNLFVVTRTGAIAAARQYPGIPPSNLSEVLSRSR
jgi:peroxiredoxin